MNMNEPFTPFNNVNPKNGERQQFPQKGETIQTIWKTIFLTLLMLILLLGYNQAFAQPYCTMVCNDNLNISIGNECSATILYDMILEDGDNSMSCSPNGSQAFKIEVMDEFLNVIPTSPTIPHEYVGRTLTVKVKHWATGNSCWATVTMQDKIPPRLVCPPNVTIPCTESTDPTVTGMATSTDCGSGGEITYEDVFTDLACGDPIGKITRIWTAKDALDNKSQCTQTIFIARPTTTNVIFPPNLDGISNPALSCIDVNANPNGIGPEYTGYPTINGKPITTLTGDLCKLNADYTDQKIASCDGSYKILRTWTVLNWCTSELRNGVQILKVEDKTPPTITAPADITVGTQTSDCKTSVPLLPAQVSDACSGDISIKIRSPFNTIDGNGGTLLDVPVGTHQITYEATDGCGNTTPKTIKLTVVDDDPPVVVCDDQTVVALTSDGTAQVFSESFDDGSYDNCCLDKILARRMDDVTGVHQSSIQFYCTDVGKEIMVEMQVTDCYGNANTCMVAVTVQDKVEPSIICPTDKTIDCESDYSDLSIFGEPQVFDNCGFNLEEEVVEDLDNCGQGTIKRTWTATDNGGRQALCTQTITVVNSAPWNLNGDQIIWPKNYETSECLDASALDPEDLPVGFGEPTFIGDNGCSLIGTNYEDLVLDIEPPACFQILRTWTVVDWCQYDLNSGSNAGSYQYEQVIKVIDNSDPIFSTDPQDLTVDLQGTECKGTVTLPSVPISDCSPNTTLTAQSAFGTGLGPFNDVNPGVYEVTYTASDGCGNFVSKDIKVTVRDGVKPSPFCIDGIAVTLMPGDAATGTPPMIDVWAKDLNQKSLDNCTAEQNLIFTIRKHDPSLTTVPDTDKVTFGCDEKGEQEVQVWVTDAEGNTDYCVTTIDIQDSMGSCDSSGYTSPDGMIAFSGRIQTEAGEHVSEVQVQISHPGKVPYVTDENGRFHYDELPSDKDYALIPEKNIHPKNGVSTLDIIKMRKHILGTEKFDSPYKMIAADVDRSGKISTLDMIATRKLILGKQDDFPNNESWRFVVKDYIFQNPGNPLTESYPELAVVNNESRNKDQVDFVAIKIGDVDYTANANGLVKGEGRNAPPQLFFELENKQFSAGEVVEATFKAKDFKEILGYQFELKFDAEVIDFQEFKKEAISNLEAQNLALGQVELGIIKMSWDDRESWIFSDGTALFTFRFKAKKAGNLSQIVSIVSEQLRPQAYGTVEEAYDLALNFKEEDLIIDKVELHQNQPNPFDRETTISFSLPTSQNATLSIFDARGKVLKQYKGNYSKGRHTIVLTKEMFPAFGLLYYILETAKEKRSKKMIVLSR